ncbi:aryl-sulfate sulfotransferase [Virgibacillus siamensis]|uniref:Aryl-sulfate sulfotransferase n=1 Tax=Virgibacillus siamensis TaxID=480071 RepID=A0ABN1G9E8_9BACI
MRKTLVIFVILAVIMVSFFVAIEIIGSDSGFNNEKEAKQLKTPAVSFQPDGKVEQLSSYSNERMKKQEKMEEQLKEQYAQQPHSIKNPFVKLDPYGVTPLSALAMFETEEPAQVTITVEGKDKHGDVTHTYEKYKTEHTISILGLYPDYQNTVTITATTKSGNTVEDTVSIQTDGLPDVFLNTETVEAHPEKMENGMTFIIPSSRNVYAVDHQANVRWYSTHWNSHVFQRLDNGHLLYITKEEGQNKYNEILEMNMLGKVYNSYRINLDNYEATNLVHHDAIELPSGNLLATVHDTDSNYIEDEMIEIDRETGKTVRDFSFRDVFPESFYQEYDGPSEDEGDWFHQNAIWYMESDKSILVSSRHQDLAMKMSYPEGEVEWILAAHELWPDSYERYLLEPVGDDFKFPGGPHAIMPLPDMDNNKQTTDYLLFDNNIVITRGDDPQSEDFSRMVQYRINPEKMTVKEVWSYGEKRGDELFSSIVGDANYHYDTGNRMLTSGFIEAENGMNSRVVEVNDEQPADVIYEIVISGFKEDSHRQAYRAMRLPLYPENQ